MSDIETSGHAATPPPASVMPTPPAPPSDEENPALIDAFKTYRYTVLGAVGFVVAALFIILSTRWG